MLVPNFAKFEADLSTDVALYDVSDRLPKHATKRYEERTGKIERIYLHHSGADGAEGVDGLFASARYCVHGRDWPGEPYTYWLPTKPDIDTNEKLVVYRCNPDNLRTYHTGRAANGHGIGVAFQGNHTKKPASEAQLICASALINWLLNRHSLTLPDALSWHSEAEKFGGKGKASCPGQPIISWARVFRGEHLRSIG